MSNNNQLSNEEKQNFDELSASLVSYWKSQTIYAAVKLGIFEVIDDNGLNINKLAKECKISLDSTKRIVRALCALKLLEWCNGIIKISSKGKFLQKSHDYSLANAALMWGEEHYIAWSKGFESLKLNSEIFSAVYGETFFDWVSQSHEKTTLYQDAIQNYAKRDYQTIAEDYNFSKHKKIMDVGGGSGILLKYIFDKYPKLNGILFEERKSIQNAKKTILKDYNSRCEFIVGDFFKEIPNIADGIILARILHDWDDEKAKIIMENCNKSLKIGDHLYIIELILPDDLNDPNGGLLSLSMLLITGGKERMLNEFKILLESNGFKLIATKKLESVSSLLIAQKVNEILH